MNKFKNIFVILAMILSACSIDTQSVSNTSGDLPYTFSQFSDIPIPENASMNLDKTAIFGRENDWVGKITFTAPYSVGGVFDFYMSEMPKFGWSEITSVRGPNSVLTYSRDSRVALIQLTPSNFQGTLIVLTMSPAPKNQQRIKPTNNAPVNVVRQNVNTYQNNNSMNNTNDGLNTISVKDSNLFVSSDAKKAMAGSLGLGDASNINYTSNSNGVGKPPRF